MVLVGINGLLRRQYGVVRFFFFVVSYWFIKLGSLINKWSWILRVAILRYFKLLMLLVFL